MKSVSIIGLGNWGNKIKTAIEYDVKFVEPLEAEWIIVATPNDLHYEQAKYWLEKGKNVFCEKPATLTYSSTVELYNIAKENNVRFYVDDVFLWRKDLPLNPSSFIWKKANNSNFIDRLAYHHFYLWTKAKSNITVKAVETISNTKFKVTLEDGSKGVFDYSLGQGVHIVDGSEVRMTKKNPLREMLLKVLSEEVDFIYNKQITLNATLISQEVRKVIYPKVLVVGGGIFGTTAAITLANNGYCVELQEALDDIMQCATGINQYRLHRGYHYPRSKETSQGCQIGLKSFEKKYAKSIIKKEIEHLYAIATEKSLINSEQYVEFLEELELPYRKVKTLPNTDLTIEVEEGLFDHDILKSLVKTKLQTSGVKVKLNTTTKSKDLAKFDIAVIATYSKLNELLNNKKQYQFEVCEKPVVKLPKDYANKSVVIMDGPFMCLDPYGHTEYHVLGNVVHAIHETNTGLSPKVTYLQEYLNKGLIKNPKYTNIKKFIETGKQFFKDFDKLEHIGSFYTIRTVLKDRDHDDARPTLVNYEEDNIYTLFSGKIGTCLEASNNLLKLIKKNNG